MMKLNEKRMVEYVLLVLFPAALFAGCAGNGNEKPQTLSENQANEAQFEQVSYAVETIGENDTVQNVAIKGNKNAEVTITPMPQITTDDTQDETLDHVVYFDTDQYTLRADDESLLTQYASKLLNNPSVTLIIHGHADERGTEAYNLHLSELRAREVEGRLLSLGVADSQLRIQSYGESTPVKLVGNWQENRRVELEYANAKVTTRVRHQYSMDDFEQVAAGLEVGQLVAQGE